MSNQYDFSAPPPSYGGSQEYSQSSYGGNSEYQSNGDRGSSGGGNYGSRDRGSRGGNFGGNYGGNRGGYNKGADNAMVTQEDTIFVSGMGPDVTEEELADHFGSIGIIKKDKRTQKPKIWIYRNKETGAGKGEATITYDDANAASSAISWFDGREFNGEKIKVSLAQRTNTWQKGAGGAKKSFGGGRGGGFGGDDRPPRSGSGDRGSRGSFGGNSGGGGGGGQSRAGDWECSDCQNKNFSWRNSCNRCQAPKPDDAGGSSGSSSGRGGRDGGQRGGFQSRDSNREGRGSFGRGGGSFNRGGPMRGDRDSGRQRPY